MMGWLWVWLRDREERRAEAAVRRQLAAVEGGRGVDSIDVEPVPDDGLPPVDVDDPSTWPADFDDGPDWASLLTFQLPEASPADVVCASCGATLLRGPVTVPAALLEHIQPCGQERS